MAEEFDLKRVKPYSKPALDWTEVATDRHVAAGPEGSEYYFVFPQLGQYWAGIYKGKTFYGKVCADADRGKQVCQTDFEQRGSIKSSQLMNYVVKAKPPA